MPPRTLFETIDCSIARTMAVLGQPWSALILRDLFIGITRFDALHAHLGVSRKVLALRLSRLTGDGIVVKRAYAERPERFDYILPDKGWQLCDILLAISAWGDTWTTSQIGPPALIRHRRCDHLTTAEIRCSHCGEPLHATDVEVTPTRTRIQWACLPPIDEGKP
jgi:DNA-binding HxlR family transcriptional regulator